MSDLEYGRRYQSRRRTEARANGLCGQCCINPAPDSFRCDTCKHHVNTTRQAWRTQLRDGTRVKKQSQWCDECIACGFHRYDCPTLKVKAS